MSLRDGGRSCYSSLLTSLCPGLIGIGAKTPLLGEGRERSLTASIMTLHGAFVPQRTSNPLPSGSLGPAVVARAIEAALIAKRGSETYTI